MADCALIGLAAGACGSNLGVGGIKQRVFLARRQDIVGYTQDEAGTVTAVEFDTYKGFVEFYISNKPGSFGSEEQAGEINSFMRETLLLKVADRTPEGRKAVNSLRYHDDLVAFVQTKTGPIEIYGKENGMYVQALTRSDGEADDADTSWNVTLQGAELNVVAYFSVGGSVAASIEYLENLVVE